MSGTVWILLAAWVGGNIAGILVFRFLVLPWLQRRCARK